MSETGAPAPTWLDLYDYRWRVARMYQEREAALRGGEGELSVLRRFRAQKDALFAHHPQSPLSAEQRRSFQGLRYFPYSRALRLEATLEPETAEEELALPASGAHSMRFRCAGRVSFTIEKTPLHLIVYWIDVYGGGLFLPFRDATCGQESYEGGRYLFDTMKGSDFIRLDDVGFGTAPSAKKLMGYSGGRILLDFNYAYNPSCAYDARWVCPLAPNENRLPIPIRAGERAFHQPE